LLRHQVPDGDLAVLVERAVDLLLDHSMQRRFAQTRVPKMRRSAEPSTAQPHTMHAWRPEPQTANSSAAEPNTAKTSRDARDLCGHARRPAVALVVTAQASEPSTAELDKDLGTPHAGSASVKGLGRADTARMATSSHARSARAGSSRYIPRAVVREVHQRDGGQCTFVSAEGKRCSERGFLELHHHDQPYARGGEATVENLRLVCRAHNGLFADHDFGKAFMRSKRAQGRHESTSPLQNECKPIGSDHARTQRSQRERRPSEAQQCRSR
jgi:hypothetical protein